jgi:3'(2'), 5'-bisphosphate nucleotidase
MEWMQYGNGREHRRCACRCQTSARRRLRKAARFDYPCAMHAAGNLPPQPRVPVPGPEQLLPAVSEIVREAGRIVMAVYAQGVAARHKADASPVTEADERAEAHIVPALRALAPGVPVVAEEAVAAGEIPDLSALQGLFWLVDPLDGTREFLARNGEFTVNVALIDAGRPVLGAVLAPALPGGPELYTGVVGVGAWLARGDRPVQPIAVRNEPPEGLTLLESRSHGDAAAMQAYLEQRLAGRRIAARTTAGSSLKLCLIAAGQADLYPRLGRTMAWDIAAGHAVLAAAGGEVLDLDGAPLRYGRAGFENPHFLAVGRLAHASPAESSNAAPSPPTAQARPPAHPTDPR